MASTHTETFLGGSKAAAISRLMDRTVDTGA
jgi:hypothetical protein